MSLSVKDLNWFKGYVVCSLRGKYMELFINQVGKNNIKIWNIKMTKEQEAIFSISVSDFFKLRPILKKTYTRVRVIKRVGLPFFLRKVQNRKGMAFGISLFFLSIFLLSSMVWSIDIKGNERITETEIANAIHEIGIHQGMFKFQLEDYDIIQEKLIYKLEDAAWIGVKLKGTNLEFTVVEKVRAEDKGANAPQNIISTKNAVIHKILAENGLPLVRVNQRVKKGDILISGVMGKEENKEMVPAKGKVIGLVWYQSSISIPLKQTWNEYTGEKIVQEYLSFGKWMLKIKGFKKVPFENYQKDYEQKVVSFKDKRLPFGLVKVTLMEYQQNERIISEAEAVKLAIEQASNRLIAQINKEAIINDQKILHQSVENGKVSLKLLFEVIEDITAIQPIIQGEPINQGD